MRHDGGAVAGKSEPGCFKLGRYEAGVPFLPFSLIGNYHCSAAPRGAFDSALVFSSINLASFFPVF